MVLPSPHNSSKSLELDEILQKYPAYERQTRLIFGPPFRRTILKRRENHSPAHPLSSFVQKGYLKNKIADL